MQVYPNILNRVIREPSGVQFQPLLFEFVFGSFEGYLGSLQGEQRKLPIGAEGRFLPSSKKFIFGQTVGDAVVEV